MMTGFFSFYLAGFPCVVPSEHILMRAKIFVYALAFFPFV
jgi:hypothetical protein